MPFFEIYQYRVWDERDEVGGTDLNRKQGLEVEYSYRMKEHIRMLDEDCVTQDNHRKHA